MLQALCERLWRELDSSDYWLRIDCSGESAEILLFEGRRKVGVGPLGSGELLDECLERLLNVVRADKREQLETGDAKSD